MKVEKGVMVMLDGLAWGITYEDGQCTVYGWMSPDDAPIHNPDYCMGPTSVTYAGSPYEKELSKGALVHVERKTTTIIKG